MAITSYSELPSPRRGGVDRESKRSYVRTWRVFTDSALDGPPVIIAGGPVAIGQTYNDGTGTDAGAFVVGVDVDFEERLAAGASWIFTANYGPFDPETTPQNPLMKPIEFSWAAISSEVVVDFDKDGDPVVNSAGDSFDPSLTDEDSRPALVVFRNQATYSPDLAYLYRNAVNDDEFLGAAPGTVRSLPITAEFVRDPDAPDGFYYKVRYEFHYKPEGWIRPVLDRGMRELYNSGAKRKIILMEDGSPAQSPVLLNGYGAQLPPNGTPYVLNFRLRPQLLFSVFGFSAGDFPGTVF